MPQLMQHAKGSKIDDEIDYRFSSMTHCNTVITQSQEWIIDSVASDHMTHYLQNLSNATITDKSTIINLSTGDQAKITHTGTVNLEKWVKVGKCTVCSLLQTQLVVSSDAG